MKYKYNGQWVDVNIKALDSMAIGCIIQFMGTTIPTGWLECDGSTITQVNYPELYDLIGGTLPDFRGRVLVGQKPSDTDFDTLGETGGSKYLQSHNHSLDQAAGSKVVLGNAMGGTYNKIGLSYNWTTYADTGSEIYSGDARTTVGQVGNSGNLQPYGVVKHIIKAKNTVPTMASIVDARSTSTTDGYSCNYVNSKLEPVTLFTGSRVSTTIQLSDYMLNYSKLGIYYTSNGVYSYVEVIPAENRKVSLITEGEAGSATFFAICCAVIILKSKSIEFYKNIYASAWDGSTMSVTNSGTDGWYRVGIEKVVGYK